MRKGDTQPIIIAPPRPWTQPVPAAWPDPMSWHHPTPCPPAREPEAWTPGRWLTRIIAALAITAPSCFGIAIGLAELT